MRLNAGLETVRLKHKRNSLRENQKIGKASIIMSPVTMEFTFALPYHVNMVEGQVTEDIVIPLAAPKGKIIIHPPKAREKRYAYQSLEEKVWVADLVKIDIEREVATTTSFDDLRTQTEPIAKSYLRRFLRYCRAETRQFWIDLRRDINPSRVEHVSEDGQKHIGSVMLTLRTLGVTSRLDDSSWKAICQDLIADAEVPFHVEALLDAQLYSSQGDYRMAAVSAAMGIEVIVNSYLKKTLRQKLVDTGRTTESQVDKFVEEISNRLLVTVGLGLLSAVEGKILEGCREAMQLRNDILHGKKKSVSLKEVKEAINSLEQLISVDEIRETLG